MTPSEIMAIDARTNGYGLNAQELMKGVMARRDEGWQLTQDGDTLFVFRPTDNNGTVEFDMMTADFRTAAASCGVFFRLLKKAGAKNVFTTYLNPALTQVYKGVKGYSPTFAKGEELTMKVRL